MSVWHMMLACDLDWDGRRAFIETANEKIERLATRGDTHFVIDCSIPAQLDEVTIGMLVVIARQAQRRGLRVCLDMPSLKIRNDITAVGAAALFDMLL